MFVHAFLSFIFLISGQWIATAWNLPLVAYNANKYVFFLIWIACELGKLETIDDKEEKSRGQSSVISKPSQKLTIRYLGSLARQLGS